jgi:hypothetical protein
MITVIGLTIQFLYMSICQEQVSYNKRVLKVYRTKLRLNTKIKVDLKWF